MMNYLLVLLLIFNYSCKIFAADIAPVQNSFCAKTPAWIQKICTHFYKIGTQGKDELYFSGYAWHNRYTYRPEKIKTFNEKAWGGGMGKGIYDKSGNWHGLYAIFFMDSHDHVEPLAGYAFLKNFALSTHVKFGIGISTFITLRSDIYHYKPFPGALPLIGITFNKITFMASYIPGAQGAGNVLFINGKYAFEL